MFTIAGPNCMARFVVTARSGGRVLAVGLLALLLSPDFAAVPWSGPVGYARGDEPGSNALVEPPVVVAQATPLAGNRPNERTGQGVWAMTVKPRETQEYTLVCARANVYAALQVVSQVNVQLLAAIHNPEGEVIESAPVVGPTRRYQWKVHQPGRYRVTFTNPDPTRTAIAQVLFNTDGVAGAVGSRPLADRINELKSKNPFLAENQRGDKSGQGAWVMALKPGETQAYNLVCANAGAAATISVKNFTYVKVQTVIHNPGGQVIDTAAEVAGTRKHDWKATPPGKYRVAFTNHDTSQTANVHVHFNTGSPALPGLPGLADRAQPGKVIAAANVDREVVDFLRQPEQVYDVQLQAGVTYVIEMTSTQFDAYLILRDDRGREVARDDDGGGGRSARILYRPDRTAGYRVTARSFASARGGEFRLTVRH